MGKILYAFVFFMLLLGSCKTKKALTPEEFEGRKLILRHGGGFTGNFKTYHILDNGQLFKSEERFGQTTTVKDFKKNQIKQIFSNYKTLGLDTAKHETYGNLYYEIKMIDEDGKEQTLKWEKGEIGTKDLQLFYDNIMNLIRINNENEQSSTMKSEKQ